MPRVKPLIKRDQRETEVLTEIGGILYAMQISQKELARRSGIHPSTLSQRMHHIGDMRLSELWAIRDVMARSGV